MLWNDFVSDISARIRPDEPDSIFEVQDMFRDAVAQGVLSDVFNRSLSDLSGSDGHLAFGNNGATILFRSDLFSINLMYFKGNLDHLYYEPLHNLTVVVNDCHIEAARYQVVRPDNQVEIDRTTHLALKDRTILRRGDLWAVDGRSEVSDLRPHGEEVPLLVTLTGTKLAGLCWAFDRQSLVAWSASSVDYEVTSMVTIADLLGRLRDRAALEPLGRMFHESPYHYARWSAVRNIGRIDRTEGVRFLRLAADDVHPEVRRAAVASLSKNGLV